MDITSVTSRTMLASEEDTWFFVFDAEVIGGVVVCDGITGDPGVSMNEWVPATVSFDATDAPAIIEHKSLVWNSDDTLMGGSK